MLALFFASFFNMFFKRIFPRFWKGFWIPKWVPKPVFGMFFSIFFLRVSWNRFFHDFFQFLLNSNLDFCAHSQCFVRIFRKSTFLKTFSKRLDFGWLLATKTTKNLEKIAFKTNAFSDVVF